MSNFHYGDAVEAIDGFYKGVRGRVIGRPEHHPGYKVQFQDPFSFYEKTHFGEMAEQHLQKIYLPMEVEVAALKTGWFRNENMYLRLRDSPPAEMFEFIIKQPNFKDIPWAIYSESLNKYMDVPGHPQLTVRSLIDKIGVNFKVIG